MLKFQTLVRGLEVEQAKSEQDDQYFAMWVFQEWRRVCIALFLKAIRHERQYRIRGNTSMVSPAWCNAAALILEIPGDDIADRFLRAAPDLKDSMVAAVLDDGGIYDERGRWVELPVI